MTPLLVVVTVKVKIPASVGVPESTPVDESMLSPAGRFVPAQLE